MNDAIKLYYEFIDLDFMDYSETLQNDLEYIQELIKKYGVNVARNILKKHFNEL